MVNAVTHFEVVGFVVLQYGVYPVSSPYHVPWGIDTPPGMQFRLDFPYDLLSPVTPAGPCKCSFFPDHKAHTDVLLLAKVSTN
jgi:hypothetical protein